MWSKKTTRMGCALAVCASLIVVLGTGQGEASQAAETPASLASIADHQTVYANLSADGHVQQATVVDWLRVSGEGKVAIRIPEPLKNVVNLSGPETPQRVGQETVWYLDLTQTGLPKTQDGAPYRDLYYQTTSDQPLPVAVSIHYQLNGKPVDANQIAGQSGKLEVTLTLHNKLKEKKQVTAPKYGGGRQTQSQEVYTPFIAMATLGLPMDQYQSVDAPKAMAVAVGKTTNYSWILNPAPDDKLTLTVQSDALKLPSFQIQLIPGVLDLPLPDLVGQMKPMADGLTQIEQASNAIAVGSKPLADGSAQIASGLGQSQAGIAKLAQLADAQKRVALQGASAAQQLAPAAQQLSEGSVQLAGGLAQLKTQSDALPKLADALVQLNTGMQQLQEPTQALKPAAQQLLKDAQTVQASGSADAQQQAQALKQMAEALQGLAEGLPKVSTGLQQVSGQATPLKALPTAVTQLSQGAQGVANGLKQFSQGMGGVQTLFDLLAKGGQLQGQQMPGLSTLASGLSQANDGLTQLQAGAQQLAEGQKQVGTGTEQLDQGLAAMREKLVEGLNTAYAQQANFDAGKAQADAYTHFLPIPTHSTAQVRFLLQTKAIGQ